MSDPQHPGSIDRLKQAVGPARHAARRALGVPSGGEYGEALSWLDARLTDADDRLQRTTRHLAGVDDSLTDLARTLRDLEEESQRVADRQADTLEGVVAAVQRANALRASLTGAVDEIAKDVHAIQARFGDLAAGFGDVGARLDELVLSRDQASARADASELRLNQALARADASDLRIDELAARCNALAQQTEHFVFQQSNEIFLAQPDLLTVRQPDGRTVLGFDATTPLGREGYRSFEDVFRGSEDFVRDRQRPYLDFVRAGDRVADLGAGRGEMLDLLREAGATAIGVDLDEAMVERMREKGHDVAHADAVEWLAARDDASLELIFSAQFVEHLPTELLPRLLADAYRCLVPDGRFIAETVNPYAPAALRAFWVDPTHVQPLYPETLLVLAQQAGFTAGHVIYPVAGPILEAGADPRVEAGEYAVVVTR